MTNSKTKAIEKQFK